MKLMAVVARQLWLRQNAMVYGNRSSHSSTVVSHASESLVAYQNANSR
jgi:hypothetical protein